MHDLSAAALLDALRAAGARITLAAGQFVVDAPAEVLTPEREAALGAHRAEVLALLRRDPEMLLVELWGLGLTLAVHGEDLHLDGPAAAQTPDRIAAIRAIKPALVEFLRRRELTPAEANSLSITSTATVTGGGPVPRVERVTRAEDLARVASALDGGVPFALQFATSGPDALLDQPRVVQIALPDHTVYSIDVTATRGLGALVPALAGKTPVTLAGQRDLAFLAQHFGAQLHGARDVVTAATLLRGGRRSGQSLSEELIELARAHFGFTPPLSEMTVGDGAITPAHEDALARQAVALLPLDARLETEVRAANLGAVAAIEYHLLPVLASMHLSGVGGDRAALTEVLTERRDRYAHLGSWLRAALHIEHLSNDRELRAALRASGIDVTKTDADTLAPLRKSHAIVADLLDWRSLGSFVTAAGPALADALAAYPDGRMRPRVDPFGAITGRFTYRRPNLQGLEKSDPTRRVIAAAPGHVFIDADYSQIDLRILAAWTKDPLLLKVFDEGGDVHALTASVITGKSLSAVTKAERQAAKAVNFGIVNGMGAAALRAQALAEYDVKMTEAEAQEFLSRFLRTYTGVARWHREVHDRRPAMLRSMAGRRRYFGAKPEFTEQLPAPVQSTGADGLKLTMIWLHRELPAVGGRVVLCLHDEVLVEVPRDRAAEARDLVERVMRRAMATVVRDSVPIVVEADVRTTWAKGSIIDLGGAR